MTKLTDIIQYVSVIELTLKKGFGELEQVWRAAIAYLLQIGIITRNQLDHLCNSKLGQGRRVQPRNADELSTIRDPEGEIDNHDSSKAPLRSLPYRKLKDFHERSQR
jgi:hypothetical protein